MNNRIKVSDLEIIERGFPLLVYVEPRDVGYWSDKEVKLPLLHISARVGTRPTTVSRFGSIRRFAVTHCNRPLEYTNVYAGGALDTNSYRLCPRCAKQQEHKVALLEYHKHRSEQDRRRKEKQEQEERENQKRRQARKSRLADFGREFFEELPIEQVRLCGTHAMRVEYKDRIYEIKEVEQFQT